MTLPASCPRPYKQLKKFMEKRDIGRKPTDIEPHLIIDNPPDENFENLLHNWSDYKDEIILFFGAGASMGASNTKGEKLPSAYELRNQIWSRFILTPQERETYDYSNLALMSLEHVSTLAEIKSTRYQLEKFVAEKFHLQKPLWQHVMIPFLNPQSIFTTNYDNLIERGYSTLPPQLVSRHYGLVFNNTTSFNMNFVPLYKPHGSIEYPHSKVTEGGIVITQFDYYEIMETRRDLLKKFISQFENKCVIFIGYSLLDFDIAAILYSLAKSTNRQSWYAVFPRNDCDVRNMLREKFGIRQINRRFFDFMYELDKSVNFIPSDWKFENVNKSLFQE